MTGTGELNSAIEKRCHDPYLRCALYGAAQTALGVTGCCVLAHSPQGCYLLVNAAFGWQDADYTETLILSTKLCENEIVHGGEELLTRTILEARELKVPIMFVLSSCGPEIVGDSIGGVCDDLQQQVEFQIVPIECAGFRGDQNDGTDIALDAMLRKLMIKGGRKISGSVCLIAPHANSNPTWTGDLAWVKRNLSRMGVENITTLTHDTKISEIENVASAEWSIVLSHDAGQKAADYLYREFDIQQLCRDIPLPMGLGNTRNWLVEVGQALGATSIAETIATDGEKLVVEQCRRKGLEQFFMHRAPVAIIADSTIGIPLVRFISQDLEMIPELICLRSCQVAAGDILERELKELNLSSKIIYNADVYQSKMALTETMPEIVFGSNIERHAVEELGIPFVFKIVNPIARFRMINREYFGYVGVLNLIEFIQNDWMDRYRSKRRSYKARW